MINLWLFLKAIIFVKISNEIIFTQKAYYFPPPPKLNFIAKGKQNDAKGTKKVSDAPIWRETKAIKGINKKLLTDHETPRLFSEFRIPPKIALISFIPFQSESSLPQEGKHSHR